MGNTLYATLLGGFSLAWPDKDGPGLIVQDDSAPPRLWTFLGYLCANHNRPMPEEDVILAVLGESPAVDAAVVMKSLLARARAMLESLGFPNGASVLTYVRGVYAWAPGLDLCVDTEEFEALERRFVMQPEDALDEVLDFLPHYQDGFLPIAVKSWWASSMQQVCLERYLRLLRGAAQALGEAGRYEEAVRLCRTAASINPLDEWSQLHLMQFLHDSGSTQSALWHYRSVARYYHDQCNTDPPQQLSALSRRLSQASQGETAGLEAIQRHLEARDDLARPLYCKYPMFQTIYHLVARSLERNETSVQLAMLTVEARGGGELTAQRCAEAMHALRTVGLAGLREGDVCTRFAPNQYLLLLPSATTEDAHMTLTRCLSAFEQTPQGRGVTVQVGVRPVRPIET